MEILFSNFWMLLLLIFVCVAVIFFTGDRLAYYAERLALVTKISGAFIGFILIAAITSMPEMIGTFVSAKQGLYGLASGGIFGSNMVNLAILSIICIICSKKDISIATGSVFSFLNSLILLALVGFFMVFHLLSSYEINKYFIVSLFLGTYFFMMFYTFRFHQQEEKVQCESPQIRESIPHILIGFIVSAGVIITVSWIMVLLCDQLSVVPIPIYEKVLGEHFIGALILALATSIPELVTTAQLIRNNSINMGVENISGSNVFNLIVLVIASLLTYENFWQVIPVTNLYTVFLIFVASLLLCMLGLIKHSKRLALGVYVSIVLIWIVSLKMVF